VLKITNFRYHGNRGLSNLTIIVNLADPENRTVEPKIAIISYIQPELWELKDFPIKAMFFFEFCEKKLVEYKISLL